MVPAPPSELPLVPASGYSNDIWLLRDDHDLVEPISFYNEHWEKTLLIQKQQASHRRRNGGATSEEVNEDTAHHPAIIGDMEAKYDQRMTLVAAPAGSQVPMNQWPNLPAASCEGVDEIFRSHYLNHPPNAEAIRAHRQVKMEGASSPLGEASMSSDSTDGSPRELQGYKHQNLLNQPHHQAQTVENTSIQVQPRSAPPQKKKRSLPGTPDPGAEVIALSPRTLMATNRFICEICNKGFQRDQNLQLHRRGHNLPWKLRQRSSQEIRKRVYICPEPSCVYHDPARALGDLTGIKKHFCRKHGEKKWKCEKCSKRYAVQSDWKAHMKTCGTREYRCDCGTLFSRRDSFITHRAFCDALAEENRRDSSDHQQQFGAPGNDGRSLELVYSLDHHRQMVIADSVAAGSGAAGAEPLSVGFLKQQAAKTGVCDRISMSSRSWKLDQLRSSMGGASNSGLSLWPLGNGTGPAGPGPPAILTHHHQVCSSHQFSSSGSSAGAASFVFNSPTYGQEQQGHLAQMSATALLQKASLMGATMGNSSILAALDQCTDAAAVSLLRRPAVIQNKMEQIAGSGGRNMEELAGMRGFRGSNAGSCSLFEINSSADTFPTSMAIMRDFEGVESQGGGALNTTSSVLTTPISIPVEGLKAAPSHVGKTATGKASFDDSPSYGESRPSNRTLSPCYGNMRSLREEHGDHQKPTLDFLGMVDGSGQTCTTTSSSHVFTFHVQ